MKLVIDINEELYYDIRYKQIQMMAQDYHNVMVAIVKGTPLPKRHGRLIDADDIDNHIIGHVDTRSCPTIIEADTEESEE